MPRTSSAARAPRFKLKPPRVAEFTLHRQIADVLRVELGPAGRISRRGVAWWSVDIAAYGGAVPGLRTTRGIIAGVPDVIVLYRGRAYFVEVKANDGMLSNAQQDVAFTILSAGFDYGIARDAQEMLQLLDGWSIPRRNAIVA